MVHFPEQESCAELLLKVLVQSGGDAVVLHAGDTPYLVGTSGEYALARTALTTAAVDRLARELMPFHAWQSLQNVGAVEQDCLTADAPGAFFKVVAGQEGNDLWIEVRRMRHEYDDDVHSPVSPRELWN